MAAVIGLPLNPLDRPITYTHFQNLTASRKWVRELRQFREIAGIVEQTVSPTKDKLPLWSCCRFGKQKTAAGSLRHDANVLGFRAIIGDHDAGTQTMEEAAGRLRDAGVAAFLHETWQSTPGKPRWRVVCPTAGELPPDRYKPLAARLNDILGGTLASELFMPSQSYYYGHEKGRECSSIFALGERTIDEVALADDWTDDVATREPLSLRSGAAASLAYRMIGEDKTKEEWVEALDDGRSETAGWVDDSRSKHRSNPDYEIDRTWNNAKKLWDKRHPEAGTALAYFDDAAAHVELGDDYLIDGVLDRKSLGVIYGDSTVGKTFFCLHMAYCIATDTPFFGRKTRKGAVLYVAAESGDRIKNRVVAISRHFRLVTEPIPVRIITSKINLYADTVDLKRIMEAAEAAEHDFGMPVVAIIIDTLARATPGMNENASEDMGLAVGRLDTLREKTGAAVPLVHHSGKDQSKGARGWSGLRAAVDHEIEITRVDDARFADLGSKQRDSDDSGKVVSFELRVVELGERSDGALITSCVIKESDDVPRPKKSKTKMPRQKKAVLDILDGLLAHGPVTMGELRKACEKSSAVCNKENRKSRWSAFDRAFEYLAQENLVFERDGEIGRCQPHWD